MPRWSGGAGRRQLLSVGDALDYGVDEWLVVLFEVLADDVAGHDDN